MRSRVGWQLWATERLMDAARNYLFPLYASLLTPWWLRLLGAKVGTGTEISTALLIPKFTVVEDGAFLADDTMVASYELGGGWIHVAKATIGKRAFLGNSGITQPGRRVPDDGLVAVLSATPHKAKAGSSWLGSPPVRLRRKPTAADALRTFHPSLRLKVAARHGRDVPADSGDGDVRASGSRCCSRCSALAVEFGWLWAALAGGRGAAGGGRDRRRHRGDREMACGRAGSARSSIRCGRRSCGATRCPTPSSRPSPRRGSPAPRAAPR